MGIPILAKLNVFPECKDGNSYSGKIKSFFWMQGVYSIVASMDNYFCYQL